MYVYIHINICTHYKEGTPAEVVSEAPTEMKPGDGENTEVCPEGLLV